MTLMYSLIKKLDDNLNTEINNNHELLIYSWFRWMEISPQFPTPSIEVEEEGIGFVSWVIYMSLSESFSRKHYPG